MSDRLHGKTCLVTGAAQGIGKAVADAFLREGARVVVTDLQAEKLSAAFDHPRAVAARMDVTDAAASPRWSRPIRRSTCWPTAQAGSRRARS